MEPANKELIEDLIEPIKSGDIQLPEFQRDFIWSRRQKSELIESMLQRHPVGTLLLLAIDQDKPMFAWTNLDSIDVPSARSYSTTDQHVAKVKPPQHLILDGQQRLTTIAQILLNPGTAKYTWFLELSPTMKDWSDQGKPSTKDSLDEWIERFDFTSNIKAQTWLPDPERRLKEKSFRLAISLLYDSVNLQQQVGQYREYANKLQDRERKKMSKPGISQDKKMECQAEIDELAARIEFTEIVLPRFATIISKFRIPAVTVPASMSIAGVCKIFTKLNSTGTALGPFDLAVAKLYPNNINLKVRYREAYEAHPQIQVIDRSGASLLSAVALFDGKSPKKNSLPDTITPSSINTYWDTAIQAYSNSIAHLNEYCGAGIVDTNTSDLLAYAPIVPALAVALGTAHLDAIKDHDHRQYCIDALQRWYFHAPLIKHYSEGTDNKQAIDARLFKEVFQNGGKSLPSWMNEPARPSMKPTQSSGARGKAILSLLNFQSPKDWIYENRIVGRGPNRDNSSQLHHIFPRDFLKKDLKDKNPKCTDAEIEKELQNIGCNSVANLAFLSAETNNSIINNSAPSAYLEKLKSRFKNGAQWRLILAAHFIDEDCIKAMEVDDFESFLIARENCIYGRLQSMGLSVSAEGGDPTGDQAANDLFAEDDTEVY